MEKKLILLESKTNSFHFFFKKLHISRILESSPFPYGDQIKSIAIMQPSVYILVLLFRFYLIGGGIPIIVCGITAAANIRNYGSRPNAP